MNIRVAIPTDAEAMTAIYAPVVANTSISFELTPPTVDEMRSRIVKTLADLPWLVSEDSQGSVDGYVYASKHRERPAYQWSVDVTAYVREDARGHGVGKRLYQALFPELATLGYFQAFAGIALPNDASVALHESVGFQPVGIYRKVGFKLGAWHDVGWWQKELRSPTEPTDPTAFGGRAVAVTKRIRIDRPDGAIAGRICAAVDQMRRGLNQIRTTVAALLPQARVEDRALEIDDFADVVTLAHPDLAHRNVQLTTQVEVESAIRVPSGVLRQVMLNMLLNGVSAAEEPGTVHAELRADAERLLFSVAHAGKALTQDALEAIVAVESGDDPRGFGLWVCREVATQYGGGFDVDSRHGQGTRLVFWMPNRETHEELAAD